MIQCIYVYVKNQVTILIVDVTFTSDHAVICSIVKKLEEITVSIILLAKSVNHLLHVILENFVGIVSLNVQKS